MSRGLNKRKGVSQFVKTHGMTGTRAHCIWMGMLNRCRNPNNKDWGQYGCWCI